MYKYLCNISEVYDADTVTGIVDLGFGITVKKKLRLFGIDTPELRTKNLEEKELGYAARDFVREKILGKNVYIETFKKGKFGRYLVDIYISLDDEKTLNSLLIEEGFALEYHGEKKSEHEMQDLIERYWCKK